MAPVLVTLNDLEGHSPVAGLFKCNPSNICAVFYQISTERARAVPQRQLGFLLILWLNEASGVRGHRLNPHLPGAVFNHAGNNKVDNTTQPFNDG